MSLPLTIFFIKEPIYNVLFLIILWHILVTIPILYAVSYKLNWNITKKDFKHPHFIFKFATGIIYPLFWGLFLSLSRYIRLGTSVDLFIFIESWRDFIILSIFLFPILILWILVLFIFISNIRKILWNYTDSLAFSLHLWFLQYYDYYFICKIIHKVHFLIYDLVFNYPGAYYRQFNESDSLPLIIKLTKVFRYLCSHIIILHSIMIMGIIFEIIISKGVLYYSIYIIFVYPFSLAVMRFFSIIGGQDLVLNMCLSDYVNYNFVKPRYYLKFWFYSKNPQIWYGIQHVLPESLLLTYNNKMNFEGTNYKKFIHFHNKLPYYIHGYKRNKNYNQIFPKIYGIRIGNPKSYGIRIAACYKSQYGVRWYHTTRPLLMPQKNLLHPFTAKFIKDPFALLALINKPGQDFEQVQRLSKDIKYWPKPEELYYPNPNILLDRPKTLSNILETNFVMRFQAWTKNNVIIGSFNVMKTKFGFDNIQAMQQCPDMVSNWINNNAKLYRGILGIDEKHKITSAVNQGRNLAINSINSSDYMELLNTFERQLQKKNKLTEEMRFILEDFKEAAINKDLDKLFTIWSDNLHIFPDKMETTFNDRKDIRSFPINF